MMVGCLSTVGFEVVVSVELVVVVAASVVNVILSVYRRNNSHYHYYNQPASVAEGSEGFMSVLIYQSLLFCAISIKMREFCSF